MAHHHRFVTPTPPCKIYFWTYKTDGWLGSEWQFVSDAAGCDFMLVMLNKMDLSPVRCKFDIPLSKVTQKVLALLDYDSPIKETTDLILTYDPSGTNYYDWRIADNKKSVEISFGKAMLAEWRRALADVKSGREDLSIGLNEDYCVFFSAIR